MHHHLALATCALKSRDTETARAELIRAAGMADCSRTDAARIQNALKRLDRA